MDRSTKRKERANDMTHEIFGNRFLGVRETPWHRIGTVIPEPIPVIDALKRAEIDFTYVKQPIGFVDPAGVQRTMDDKVAVLRSPTSDDAEWRTLGIVSQDFEVLPNDELAQGLDDIAQATGWKLETVGALRHGETIFMSLKTGEKAVKGDPFNSYILVSDSKTAGRSLQITMVPIRVVCANTLNAALNAATFDVKIKHTKGAADEYEFWTGLVPQMQKREETVFEHLEAMADCKIDQVDAKKIISAAYPLPIMTTKLKTLKGLKTGGERAEKLQFAYDYWRDYALRHQDAAYTLYERFNASDEAQPTQNGKVAGTAYAALQAVTELADWGGGGSDEKAAMSSLFGDRAKVKARAWKAAEGLI